MLNVAHPFVNLFADRRQVLGLSLVEFQTHLASHGFNYSLDMIQAIEQGDRGFPMHNPGFTLAVAESLAMPISSVQQTVRATTAERSFWRKVERLRPQNQVLLRLVLQHPNLTLIPGFNVWFELVKAIALQLPDEWFVDR